MQEEGLFFLQMLKYTLKRLRINRRMVMLLIPLLVLVALFSVFAIPPLFPVLTSPSSSFIASIDTMKASRDTETHHLSQREITTIVNLSARLHTNYITVDTRWDYPGYMQQWITAIRATRHHVWFRTQPNQWENNNGASGLMTPAHYEVSERSFILAHPSFFQAGDILDPCPEPEEGHYWKATYGPGWTSHAPNRATREYNAFLRNTTTIADAALHQKGISGVITTVRSTNSFFASHPGVLERATVNKFGRITVDSYPERYTTNPAVAVHARLTELQTIEDTWHVPIIIGEMGYSNTLNVDDATQQAVLKAEFAALAALPYLAGTNYWVGAGSDTSGGYTHIFSKANAVWALRPAAYELAAFYQTKENTFEKPN